MFSEASSRLSKTESHQDPKSSVSKRGSVQGEAFHVQLSHVNDVVVQQEAFLSYTNMSEAERS